VIEIVNNTTWSAGLYPGWGRQRQPQITLVIKAGFWFDDRGEVTPMKHPPVIEESERLHDDAGDSSLAAACDTVPYKESSELLLFGTAYPPQEDSTVMEVSVGIRRGEDDYWQKSLTVYGAREWRRGLTGATIGQPECLTPLPLCYEYAYGGTDPRSETTRYDKNPVGMGYSAWSRYHANLHVPQIELADSPLKRLTERPEPAGLGPIPGFWELRAQLQPKFDKELIGDILWSHFPDLQPRHLKMVPDEESATAALRRLCQQMQAGLIDSALLCGVDSLIDAQYFDELASEGRLLTQALPQGLIPGEGGGAVLLQPVNRLQSGDREANKPLALIGNLGLEPEPHVGSADSKPMKGMVNAIRAATAHNEGLLEKMTCLLYAIPAETKAQLEWYQVNNQLWPQRLDEPQRMAMMLGEAEAPQIDGESSRHEYNLTNCLGVTGAATLPILIALSCEQIRFDIAYERWGFDRHTRLLVCEFGDQPWRGALWLTPPDSLNLS
jgi:hypothetical protein